MDEFEGKARAEIDRKDSPLTWRVIVMLLVVSLPAIWTWYLLISALLKYLAS